jgi:glycosyltransferase involved in cell wall biosynthesis
MSDSYDKVCLVGHPYAPIGMGEHVRCTYRALRSVALRPTLTDIYRLGSSDTDELNEFSGACTDRPSDINVFHINGDEVEHVLEYLSQRRTWKGYNIIYPLWELAKYPIEWARQLDRFDEIWAPSRFIYNSLRGTCTKPVIHMPLACEIVLTSFLGRRYFGIPESDYTFLFFYDLRSYTTRKNPQAVVRAFRTLLTVRSYSKARLIIKVNGVETNPEAFHQLSKEVSDLKGPVTLFQKVMTNNEVKNLVRCCDCFVSLHRSEGYGFGIAEAMVLGKPAIATAFSGNMDFMDPNVSYGIGYSLVPLKEGDYPHYQDQVWAEPDWEAAASCMATLMDDPEKGRVIGKRASLHMKTFSYRTTGLRYADRIETILQNRGRLSPE